jgi:hypothetical protein
LGPARSTNALVISVLQARPNGCTDVARRDAGNAQLSGRRTLIPLLANLMTLDQTRELATLKLERHAIEVSNLEMLVCGTPFDPSNAEGLHAHQRAEESAAGELVEDAIAEGVPSRRAHSDRSCDAAAGQSQSEAHSGQAVAHDSPISTGTHVQIARYQISTSTKPVNTQERAPAKCPPIRTRRVTATPDYEDLR